MYGMVNLAIEKLIRGHYGDEIWAAIRSHNSLELDHFLTMEQYPDQLSFDILVSASSILGRPVAQLLEQLGEYWIEFAARSGYGELMEVLGDDVLEALQNLDNLHTRVGLAFSDLRPPSFWVTDVGSGELVLHYQSQRAGLAPMVIGLVKGLGRRFAQNVRIEELDSVNLDHHCFRVILS